MIAPTFLRTCLALVALALAAATSAEAQASLDRTLEPYLETHGLPAHSQLLWIERERLGIISVAVDGMPGRAPVDRWRGRT